MYYKDIAMKKHKFDVDIKLTEYLENVEDIHKLVSLLKKYCDSNKNSDDLYEVSEVINIVEEKLNTLAYIIFADKYNNEEQETIKSVLRKIKQAKK